jgi:putative tryptophan/tyrosine transport system substrate-binding protein
MRRREFIALLGGTAIGWPLSVVAQSPDRKRKIGVLWGFAATDLEWSQRFGAFSQALQALGWAEGRNLAFEIRHAVGKPDELPALLPALAADLVAAKVDVIVVNSAGLADLAHRVTTTIPIVVASASDLEGAGLVTSLARPGGNVTGLQILSPTLMSKRVELLKELNPELTRMAIILPITPVAIITPRYIEVIERAGNALGIQASRIEIRSAEEFAPSFAATARAGDQAAIVIANPLSVGNRKVVAASAAASKLPTTYEFRSFVIDGGLVSYGPPILPFYRDVASYVDKILRGAEPGDLPVQQPTKFELIFNLKTVERSWPFDPALTARSRRRGNRVNRAASLCTRTLLHLLRTEIGTWVNRRE